MTPEIAPPQPPPPGPGGRRSQRPGTGTALALLVAVVVAAPAWLIAVYATPLAQRAVVAWSAGAAAVLLCAAVAVAAHAVLVARGLRHTIALRDASIEALRASSARFADVTVPALVQRLREGASAETALAAAPPTEDEPQRRVLTTVATEVHRGEGRRAAAMSACANAAGRVQALATSMAADLREMEHRHSDEDVLGDLLHLDHRTAQAGRLADSIAVLTGARSGRRWAKPIVMESILRGALGRIAGYQRVRLHSTSTVAVAGHAAEGVMHALAELMDNAANFSPPTSEVHVYVEEVSAGVVITVEDGGLVMGDVALRRAEQAVSAESLDLTTLSGTRLGLPVVGRLARKHGLTVSFRPSAHGGTGVLMMIPQELITQTKREERPAVPRQSRAEGADGVREPERRPRLEALPPETRRTSARGDASKASVTSDVSDASAPAESGVTREPSPEHAPAPETGESGLPKRRRGQTLAAASKRAQTPPPRAAKDAEGARSPERSGSRFGAFRRAVQGGQPSAEGGPSEDAGTGEDTGADPRTRIGEGTAPPQASASATPSLSPSSSRPEDDTE
ncbi:sensor histidine kinase [Streptomyces daliensis]|uniref:histidine kinase n=1 Tax=Streptomyces daliensis TaxID=299421 RepID=A0A8T4J3I6_9ACTN|nr:ATP-binding protein [Streptomyces daliensis]